MKKQIIILDQTICEGEKTDMKVKKSAALIFGMFLSKGIRSENNKCKEKERLSALSLIDNSNIFLDDQRIIKLLFNFEQQKLYDNKYYNQVSEKWKTRESTQIKKCIDPNMFNFKDIEDLKWYEEAKKIYFDGNLILPISTPIIPGIQKIDEIYDKKYLNNKIAYVHIKDYVKCIERESDCENSNSITKFIRIIEDMVIIAGMCIASKGLTKCLGDVMICCLEGIFAMKDSLARMRRRYIIDPDISEVIRRRFRTNFVAEVINNDVVEDYSESSVHTVLNEEFELDQISVESESLSQYSDSTVVEDYGKKITDLTEFLEVNNRSQGRDM